MGLLLTVLSAVYSDLEKLSHSQKEMKLFLLIWVLSWAIPPREILIVDEPLAYPGNDFAGTQLFYFAIVGDKLKLAPYRGHNTGQELPNSTYAWVDPINKRMVLSKIIIVVA
ncbi:hypothetical protein HPC37_04320 [Pasteurellaceae bacterium 20609_3]|uniref:hypothetical protein n=1 Tax=Spirabiliibacterium mucosae TaxID=28156 RepID=UPI001AADB614|nr:hypothetical protein [Spirabiliibacterium mucosae]MBE2898067.1 hypothetical protein [Spirabiliibacterium mucosae]